MIQEYIILHTCFVFIIKTHSLKLRKQKLQHIKSEFEIAVA